MRMTQAQSLLKQAGATIRHLVSENSTLMQKMAEKETEERIERIAKDMEEKGLSPDLDLEEKVSFIRNARNLEAMEEAVKIAAPQGTFLGGPSDRPGNNSSAFETFILTGDDLNY